MWSPIILVCLASFSLAGPVPQLDGRIVGGEPTTIQEYPYQVSVRYYNIHICGGSIIDANTVLTAAHCVYKMIHRRFSIRAGSTVHRNGEQHNVSKVIQHEGYDPDLTDNDMAILKLATPLIFSNKIQPIELQPKGEDVPAGTKAYVTGWGSIAEGSQVTMEILRVVDVEILADDDCKSHFSPGDITEHMMCAQTPGHDSCQGDSGGPLAANGKLVGVVSWGYGCARPQYPGVYAKVSNMRDWVEANR